MPIVRLFFFLLLLWMDCQPILAQNPSGQSCLLSQCIEVVDVADWDPSDVVNQQKLSRMLVKIHKRLNDPWVSYREKNYLEGVRAYAMGDDPTARRSFYKYLALLNQELPGLDDSCRQEVQVFLKQSTSPSKPHMSPREIQPNPVKPSVPAKRPSASDKKSTRPTQMLAKIPVDELIDKAQQAKDDGQFVKALKMLELGRQMSPGSEQLEQELMDLKDEMGLEQ